MVRSTSTTGSKPELSPEAVRLLLSIHMQEMEKEEAQ